MSSKTPRRIDELRVIRHLLETGERPQNVPGQANPVRLVPRPRQRCGDPRLHKH